MATEVEAMPKRAAPTGRAALLDYETLLSGRVYELTAEDMGGREYETVRSCLYAAAKRHGCRVTVQRHGDKVYVQRVVKQS